MSFFIVIILLIIAFYWFSHLKKHSTPKHLQNNNDFTSSDNNSKLQDITTSASVPDEKSNLNEKEITKKSEHSAPVNVPIIQNKEKTSDEQKLLDESENITTVQVTSKIKLRDDWKPLIRAETFESKKSEKFIELVETLNNEYQQHGFNYYIHPDVEDVIRKIQTILSMPYRMISFDTSINQNSLIVNIDWQEFTEEPIRFYFPNDYFVVDIETTGLDYETDEIVEIAAMKVVNNHIESMENWYNKDAVISDYLKTNTTLTQEFITANGIDIDTAVQKFRDYVGYNSILVGHNIGFDISFLRQSMRLRSIKQKTLYSNFSNYFIDTMLIAKYFSHSTLKKHSVDFMVANDPTLNPKKLEQHFAISDIQIEKNIFDQEKDILGKDFIGEFDADLMGWALPKYNLNEVHDEINTISYTMLR